jgi:predicted ferric reductase
MHVTLYVLIVIGPLAILALTSPTYYGLVSELGRSAALIGFMMLALQPLLAGRFGWVERPFGFDIVIRYHRYMATLALTLIILHPVLLGAGDYGFDMLYSLGQPWHILAGKGALLVLVVAVILGMFRIPGRLGFERWRMLHDILFIAVLIPAFMHSRHAGTDLGIPWMRRIWTVTLAGALLAFAYHRLLRPFLLSRRPYRVIDVSRSAEKVWHITLAPPEGRQIFDYLPGQFQFVTFYRNRGLPEEEHHWTISSSPTERDSVGMTIKELGDFTATIGRTRPGDRAAVQAPFGRFSYLLHPDELDLVFIAGGIGITPLMSMLRHMRDTGSNLPVLLIYANRDRTSTIFLDELTAIERGGSPKLRVIHVLSDPGADWEGETGRIDRHRLERLCGGRFAERAFYVCGPPGLLKTVIDALARSRVPARRIHTEIFSFLD